MPLAFAQSIGLVDEVVAASLAQEELEAWIVPQVEQGAAHAAIPRGGPMRDENINHAFLDGVLAGEHVDIYYHFGVASDDPILEEFRDVRAIVLAGSGERIKEFAQRWSALHDPGLEDPPRAGHRAPATAGHPRAPDRPGPPAPPCRRRWRRS